MSKFLLGAQVMTPGFSNLFEDQVFASMYAQRLVNRHVSGDYGDLDEHDRQANEDAIIHEARILSCYTVRDNKVYVITEADRSVTTVLLAQDY